MDRKKTTVLKISNHLNFICQLTKASFSGKKYKVPNKLRIFFTYKPTVTIINYFKIRFLTPSLGLKYNEPYIIFKVNFLS